MPTKTQTWRVKELLDWSVEYLTEKDFKSPRLEAEWLLSHALEMRRLDLYLQFDRPLSRDETGRYKTLLKERMNHKPLQYITGTADFMGLPFSVGEGVLVPRPETEQLVELALDLLKKSEIPDPNLLDVCTGCGNIGISLAHFLPGAKLTCIENSAAAIDYAVKNAAANANDTEVEIERLDAMREPLPDGPFDMIISNPPYIPEKDMSGLPPEVFEWEPHEALAAGEDGLDFVRRLVSTARGSLKPGGFLLIEIGGDAQKEPTIEMLKSGGYLNVEVFDDLNGIPRFGYGVRGE